MTFRFFFLLAVIFLFINLQGNVSAQETFGPICDSTIPGVTCAATATTAPIATFGPICDTTIPGVTCAATATTAPIATSRPTALPPVGAPPVSGNAETTLLLLALSGVLTLGGLTSFASLNIRGK